jgi:hypothetical protein
MEKAKKIIEEFGGLTKAARAMELPISTVQGWMRGKGYVPSWQMSLVHKSGKKIGLNCTKFWEHDDD